MFLILRQKYISCVFVPLKAMPYTIHPKDRAEEVCFELIDEADESCGNWIVTIDNWRLRIEGVAVPSVGIIGLVGNFLVVAVLLCLIRNTESTSQRNFDKTLIGLTIIDFTLVLVYMTDSYLQNYYSPHNSTDLLPEPVWYQVSEF